LVLLAQNSPNKFTPNSKIIIDVAGRSQIETWEINVVDERNVLTPYDTIDTVYLYRENASSGKKTEAWLAPRMHWYPVRLIFTDEKGFRLEQSLQKISFD
jgi:hypothetical protein